MIIKYNEEKYKNLKKFKKCLLIFTFYYCYFIILNKKVKKEGLYMTNSMEKLLENFRANVSNINHLLSLGVIDMN